MLGDVVEQNITRLNAKIEELDAEAREGRAACERAKLGWRPAGCGERPLFYEMPARAVARVSDVSQDQELEEGRGAEQDARRGGMVQTPRATPPT